MSSKLCIKFIRQFFYTLELDPQLDPIQIRMEIVADPGSESALQRTGMQIRSDHSRLYCTQYMEIISSKYMQEHLFKSSHRVCALVI